MTVTERRPANPHYHVGVHNGRVVYGYLTDGMRRQFTELIDRFQVRSVIEVGSFVGLTACWFAERVESVVTIDTFDIASCFPEMLDQMPREHYEAAQNQYFTFLENTVAYPNIRGIKLPSLEAARLPIEADLVYIDANHNYEPARADYEAWLPHARKVICGDDNTRQWPSIQRLAREVGADTTGRIWWKAVEA